MPRRWKRSAKPRRARHPAPEALLPRRPAGGGAEDEAERAHDKRHQRPQSQRGDAALVRLLVPLAAPLPVLPALPAPPLVGLAQPPQGRAVRRAAGQSAAPTRA